MEWFNLHSVLTLIQHAVSVVGILIIISGVLLALSQYIFFVFKGELISSGERINRIRLNFGRILILGLEFIVAADLIGSVTAPDYYSVGLLAIIVAVRTLLSFSINREIASLSNHDQIA